MKTNKRCIVTLSVVYAIALIVNIIPSATFPDATIRLPHAIASVALVLCMIGTCLMKNRVAKLYTTALLFASVTVFTLNSFEMYMHDILLLDALFSIQYPLFILFVSPLFGLNFFMNVEAEYVSLITFFIAILLLILHEIAMMASRERL